MIEQSIRFLYYFCWPSFAQHCRFIYINTNDSILVNRRYSILKIKSYPCSECDLYIYPSGLICIRNITPVPFAFLNNSFSEFFFLDCDCSFEYLLDGGVNVGDSLKKLSTGRVSFSENEPEQRHNCSKKHFREGWKLLQIDFCLCWKSLWIHLVKLNNTIVSQKLTNEITEGSFLFLVFWVVFLESWLEEIDK